MTTQYEVARAAAMMDTAADIVDAWTPRWRRMMLAALLRERGYEKRWAMESSPRRWRFFRDAKEARSYGHIAATKAIYVPVQEGEQDE